MNDLIKERDERTRKRKKTKKKMDSIIGLSYHDKEKQVMSLAPNSMSLKSKSIRLLDEGYIDNGFVIKKGTMEKFLNGKNEKVRGWEMTENGWERTEVLNLTDDFVGTVNLGHMDFATFPFIIGEWDKSDLTLVDIGNDRKGLDVNLRLDNNSIFVKELKRQPYDIGISSEFWYSVNEEDTENLSNMLGEYMPIIDEIYIFAYGLVGECGNVNSSGLELKGDFDMKGTENIKINLDIENADEIIEELTELENEIENDGTTEELEPETEEVTDDEDVEEDTPDPEELISDESVDTDEILTDDEPDDEESTDDEIEETEDVSEDEEVDDEEVEIEDVVEAAMSEMREEVANLEVENKELRSQVEALKKSNNRLSKKIADEKEKKASFISKFSGMAEKMGIDDTPKVKDDDTKVTDYIYGDGIGV